MQRGVHHGVLALVLACVGFSAGAADDAGFETIRADGLKGHVYFLASSEMGGRDSLSLEGRIAAQYLAGFFHRLRLDPVGDRGTYFQQFSMIEAQLDPSTTYLRARVLRAGGRSVRREYTPGIDFTMPRGSVDVQVEAPLVFAGYGISAPEYDYDDFNGVDVAGKVVMALTHEPQEGDPQSRFMGRFHTIHAYNLRKLQVIQRHRAAAVLMAQEAKPHRAARATSGPTNSQIMSNYPSHRLTSPYGDVPVFTITRRLADELLAPTGKTIDQLQADIDRTGRPHSLLVDGLTVDLRQGIQQRRVVQTRNVVGLIEGSDPALKDEYVVVTAHYDHVGQKNEFVFHGADDNASGCAGVLAIAEAFRASPVPPRRSVLFLVFEAEEDGLLGAVHYVHNPIVPLDKTVAVLNMDMIGRDEETETWNIKAADSRNHVNIVGTLYSPDLRQVIDAENGALGLTLDYKTDGDDRQNWFSRSDHFPFATQGVPMVLFNTGEHPDYHTAQDTWDRINYPKMEKIVRLVYLSAKNLANSARKPRFVHHQTVATSSSSVR